jgi:uncharacterized protein (DUF2252 family)
VVATAFVLLGVVAPSARGQLRPSPAALASAPAELLDGLRADPFTYFRFINRAWIARACQAFADLPDVPVVRLHGDAHVEQFAVTETAWGLVDFDDSARGPQFIDLVRFLGSIDLATRQREWTRDRDAVWNRFLEGYRRGLSDPAYRSPEPGIVRLLRPRAPVPREAYLGWAEAQMQPMDEGTSKSVVAGMDAFERFMRRERPEIAPGYFGVIRAGWLRIGVGSAALRKVLLRVQGPTAAAEDDVLLEAKEAATIDGVGCLERPTAPPAVRVIDSTRQLGRMKHTILAVGPTLLIPAAADRAEHWLEWWVSSWEPSYRELELRDLRSVEDLAAVAFDSGVQLGAGGSPDASVRARALSSLARLDGRLRKETTAIVDDLLLGWREVKGR